MTTPDFTTIEGVFTSFAPSDMLGTMTPSLGQDPAVVSLTAFDQLRQILENNGRGVYSTQGIITKINDLSKDPNNPGVTFPNNLSQYLTFYSTKGTLDASAVDPNSQNKYIGPDGSVQTLGDSVQQLVGADFQLPQGVVQADLAVICSRSPYFSPMTRNTHLVEPFINNMPSIVLSSLVPFLQVEFMVTRPAVSDQLQAAGLMKFLLGATSTANANNAQNANDAMLGAHQVGSQSGNPSSPEVDFAGMEMFTAPQTLYNPTPNVAGTATGGARYADIIDPTRPFATLESATISIVPAGAGFYTYKKASLQIKIHDRSRLSEISDLIRPRVYTGVTVWLTYGWRAPMRPGDNPYFDYVNNNMLMREAYGIINSNFSFDQVGQVVLTLELFTKGVQEMRQSKISDNLNDGTFKLMSARQVGEQIQELFVSTGLDPNGQGGAGTGLSRDTRAFMVLDAMEQGQLPNLPQGSTVASAIQDLSNIMSKTKGIDASKAQQLIDLMKKYADNYADVDKSSKFAFNKTRVTDTVKAMFDEVMTGADPFLPLLETSVSRNGKTASDDLTAALSDYNKKPKSPTATQRNTVVSFGKLFMVFAARNIISSGQLGTHEELQLFFYQMNEQCGPVSNISIAQFPIDMAMFLDQYREHVIRNGGERITLEDFLSLVVNSQFLDGRSLAYGLKGAYQPYDTDNPEAKLKDKQANQPSYMDAWQTKYGSFKQPMIEMYIECAHQRPDSDTGAQTDALQAINFSANDASVPPPQKAINGNIKRIMRIHLYDKQLNPYKGAAMLLRDNVGKDFLAVQPPGNSIANLGPADGKQIAAFATAYAKAAPGSGATQDPKTNTSIITQPSSYTQAKDIVSKMVPTIRFGSNGTTILNAALASKADPRVSSVQMQRTMNIRNDAHPAGGGERGFPVRVIPAMLNMTTLGNPLATMAQLYFIDFQTGTTLDNIYIVTGLTHTIVPGKFETNWQFGYADAYGVWEGAQQLDKWISTLSDTVPAQKK